ncbi:MAG: dihydropteroate synthase [Clostridia bacterium]|jgi:dihydropteroate synthase|nr:dihydropteroate synthase [Clostridia bacterium]
MRNILLNVHRKSPIKAGKHILNLGERTYIMGILNVTPDSFSDGGDFVDVEAAVKHAKQMVADGADIIDIGGESTRPGSAEVGEEDEIKRVIPVIERLAKEIDVPISIDTYKASVAEKAIQAGAHIINDIWGMQKDPEMAQIAAKYQVPVVIMHNQLGTEYSRDIMEEMCIFLRHSIDLGLQAGMKLENMILDPGIGFGKTAEQNVVVMARLGELNDLGCAILLGTSRKSFIGKILDLVPKERVEGTIATTVMGIIQGADIVRVHDVIENLRAAKVTDAAVRGWKSNG